MAIENEKSNGQVMAVSLPSEPVKSTVESSQTGSGHLEPKVQLPVDPKVQLPVDPKGQLPVESKVQLPATPSKKAPTNVNQTPETIQAKPADSKPAEIQGATPSSSIVEPGKKSPNLLLRGSRFASIYGDFF